MKRFTVALLLCISLVSQAQVEEGQKPGRWRIGLAISPELAHRRILLNSPLYESMFPYRQQERPRFGHTSGLYVNYFFNDVFGLGSGLSYSLKGYQIPWSPAVWDRIDGVKDSVYHSYAYGRHFVDIPLTAIVKVGSGRFRSISQAGVVLNSIIGSSNRSVVEYQDGRTYRSSSYHSLKHGVGVIYLSGVISTGVSYEMSKRLELRLEPVLRYMFWNSEMDRDPYYMHYWNAGLSLGAFVSL
jgi:hypothetical protein